MVTVPIKDEYVEILTTLGDLQSSIDLTQTALEDLELFQEVCRGNGQLQPADLVWPVPADDIRFIRQRDLVVLRGKAE